MIAIPKPFKTRGSLSAGAFTRRPGFEIFFNPEITLAPFSAYFNDNVNIQNLAISGRSSKSFIKEKSYLRLKDEIKESDYLIIGFGHNDEKYDDNTRFTSALYDENEKESFAYYLLNYYVKLALEKKAIPILCTPVARANKNNDYTSFCAHITENGDYRNRIITLALKYDITCKTYIT